MQVKRKFNPVDVTLETEKELNLFWLTVEESCERYEIDSDERNFLIKLSNIFC